MTATNYFKLIGSGRGRASDCFPFDSSSPDSEREAHSAAVREANGGSVLMIRPKIASWRRSRAECPVIGETDHLDAVAGMLS